MYCTHCACTVQRLVLYFKMRPSLTKYLVNLLLFDDQQILPATLGHLQFKKIGIFSLTFCTRILVSVFIYKYTQNILFPVEYTTLLIFYLYFEQGSSKDKLPPLKSLSVSRISQHWAFSNTVFPASPINNQSSFYRF